jgi:hypothetical protein
MSLMMLKPPAFLNEILVGSGEHIFPHLRLKRRLKFGKQHLVNDLIGVVTAS